MTKDKSKKNNVVLGPKYGAAHFESQDKCPKCNTQMVLKELKKGDFKECPQCKFKEEVNNNE